MANTLTKKQSGFVSDYLATGNGALAVKKNYDVQDNATARSIASENLTKPNIQQSLHEAMEAAGLSNTHLASKIAELVNAQKRTPILRHGAVEMIREEMDTTAVKAGLEFALRFKPLPKEEPQVVTFQWGETDKPLLINDECDHKIGQVLDELE